MRHPHPLQRFERAAVCLVVTLLLAAFFAGSAFGATTLTPSVTSADGQLVTQLTWESTHSNCEASGLPSWEGPKPSSGTVQLPAITMSGTYTLALACSTPPSLSAVLSWDNPTTNTDGSAYTNAAGTRIAYGTRADALVQVVEIPNPNIDTYTLDGLTPGEWFFGAKAFNTNGTESVLSNLVTKVTSAGGSEVERVTLTVNPIPGPPTNLQVE